MLAGIFIATSFDPLPVQANRSVTGTSEETPVKGPAQEESAKKVEEYWTEDRMREAKPMPMPSPEKRARCGSEDQTMKRASCGDNDRGMEGEGSR
jgi:hypothetical protein